jgi:uncharacterized OsmC-like protein
MADQVNDVNVAAIKELDQMVRVNPALGKFTLKVKSTWQRGTKAQVTVGPIHALGNNLFPRTRSFVIMADDPPGLGGVDSAPAPAEILMAALAGCVTSGIATNAALFDVPLDGIDLDMEADIDVRYTVTIQSPAPEDKVRRCKETIDRKSPVRDTLANPVTITSELVYKQS